ncbi:MAG: tRNA lysidine(34) synthetase TilS [Hyphomicrobium sp.]|nr:tRNA lysidine(34) synthetase TilS [Hyphomicrobium sp.]
MTTAEAAIAVDEADRAFERLRNFRNVVLAVSGGPDSLALLTLVAEWRGRLGPATPAISVATVDHHLRPGSATEARAVAAIAAELGLPHATLDWAGDKPRTGIPDAARAARYALLDSYARSVSGGDAVAVVTAHHQDDQAETVFMRLMRGGGVAALAAMPAERSLSRDSNVTLVRPLLAFSKARLIATLARRDVSWFDDPSNENAAFERVRVRAVLAEANIDAAALATSARRMREASDGLRFAARAFSHSIDLVSERNIYARFDRGVFDDGPVILRQMVLEHLIACFGGATGRPELAELETLAQRFAARAPFTVTLGGAVISAGSRYVRLWREAGRIDAAPLVLNAQSPVRWDERYILSIAETCADVIVKPLGLGHADQLVLSGTKDIPRAALAGLPAFYDDATLIGVPILTSPEGRQTLADGGQIRSEPIPQPEL